MVSLASILFTNTHKNKKLLIPFTILTIFLHLHVLHFSRKSSHQRGHTLSSNLKIRYIIFRPLSRTFSVSYLRTNICSYTTWPCPKTTLFFANQTLTHLHLSEFFHITSERCYTHLSLNTIDPSYFLIFRYVRLSNAVLHNLTPSRSPL